MQKQLKIWKHLLEFPFYFRGEKNSVLKETQKLVKFKTLKPTRGEFFWKQTGDKVQKVKTNKF